MQSSVENLPSLQWPLCLCARLYLGVQLYCGKNEYEMESITSLVLSIFNELLCMIVLYVYMQDFKIWNNIVGVLKYATFYRN